jgi:hypothetical protein
MRYCGRDFTEVDIDLIRELLKTPQMNRARLSREVCERLEWRRENGALKDMSCRVALLRMQSDRLIRLPAPRNPKPITYRSYPHIEQAILEPATLPTIDLARLTVEPVLIRAESLLWNAYIERHHYLGHQLMPGAQLRYFVRAAGHIIPAPRNPKPITYRSYPHIEQAILEPATSSPPWASARAPGRSNRAINSSAGRPSSGSATCTSS